MDNALLWDGFSEMDSVQDDVQIQLSPKMENLKSCKLQPVTCCADIAARQKILKFR